MNYSGRRFGHYRLIRLIGRGGFADVYEAWDIHLARRVAIKILHSRLTMRDQQAFLHEARVMSRMDHPHIVRVLEFTIHSNIPYLVMTYAPNGSLHQRHPLGERLPLDTIMHYLWQIVDALTYIHEKGFVHQDIKPENLLVGEDNGILLADFGIVTLIRSTGSQESQELIGTATYMAPERINGESQPASDQYSLAILVYEWVTGNTLFYGSSSEKLLMHLHVSPSLYMEGVPLAIKRILLKALAKNPKDRFENVQQFALALERARSDRFEKDCSKMPFTFVMSILVPSFIGLGLYLVGVRPNIDLLILKLGLLVLPVSISLLWRSKLGLKLAIGCLAIAVLLGLALHSCAAFLLTLLILLLCCVIIGSTITLIFIFRRS